MFRSYLPQFCVLTIVQDVADGVVARDIRPSLLAGITEVCAGQQTMVRPSKRPVYLEGTVPPSWMELEGCPVTTRSCARIALAFHEYFP